MLINLMAINKNEDLIIDLPYMKFSNHYVTLTELFIEWTEPVHAYGYISSTLVDRNAFNPKQQIFQFCQEQPSIYLYRTPTHFQTYKIQRTELETAEFKLRIQEKTHLSKIKNIFLQLNITDAGIQQRPEFKIQ